MGKKGPKASNIYQNPGIKNNPGNITDPSIVGIGSPLKHLTKRGGKSVSARHKAKHDAGTAHPSIGEAIGRTINKAEEIGHGITKGVNKIGEDIKKTRNKDDGSKDPIVTKEPVEDTRTKQWSNKKTTGPKKLDTETAWEKEQNYNEIETVKNTPAKHVKRDNHGRRVKHSYASHPKGSSENYIAQLERTKWKRKKGDKSNVYNPKGSSEEKK